MACLSTYATAIAVLLLGVPRTVQAGRLLLVPLASDSHISAFTALSTELEKWGRHEIYMAVSKEMLPAAQSMASARSPDHNHHYITYPLRFDLFADDMAKMGKANFLTSMFYGYRILAAMMEMVIGNEQLLSEIRQLQPDLIIGDAVGAYGHWLGGLLGVPSIEFDVGTSSGMLHSGLWGGQLNPSYIPGPGTLYPSTGMTLWQRSVNAGVVAFSKVVTYAHNLPWGPIGRVAARHGGYRPGTGPSRPLLLLVNFDWALEPPRPVAPSTHFLGPLMPRPAAPLPEDVSEWLEDGAGEGEEAARKLPVVYISFGSSFMIPAAAMPAIASAISSARKHVRFLLRMRGEEHADLTKALASLGVTLSPREALVRPRFPQNDVLGHPAVRAFVTQGGYLSMQEAAWHGVPTVGIPLTLGQGELVRHAADHGRGMVVRKEHLMAGDAGALTEALVAVATNESFQEQAAIASARIRAHARSPGQRAADLVAYALALPRAGSFLHTQGQDSAWWQVILLDVVLVYATVLGTAAFGLGLGLRRLLGCKPHRQPQNEGRQADGQGPPGKGKRE